MCRKKFVFFSSVILAVVFWVIFDYFAAVDAKLPAPVDLSALCHQSSFTEEEYQLIFHQTGLGRSAVDELCKDEDFADKLLSFQNQKQKPVCYRQTFLFFPTTTAEQLQNEQKTPRYLQLPPLRAGDILITRSTKTLLYRHGHAGLVAESDRSTIESLMIGSPSARLSLENWLSYPTLLVLRPKELSAEDCQAAVRYAEENLLYVPYDLLTGVLKKDKSDMKEIDGTQCAHLIWQAYRSVGLDLDGDGGFLVTPNDIAKSPLLEIVFSYGFSDDGAW